MIPDAQGKTEPREIDPDKLAKQLEIELIQQRAKWQQAQARGRSRRALAYGFIFLVVLAALVGFFFFFTGINQERAQRQQSVSSGTP